MRFKELVIQNRSIRTFDESVRISRDELADFADCARLAASARNAQPLKFRLVYKPEETEALLALTRWAGYITDRKLPPDGHHPTAFIVICHDTEVDPKAEDCTAAIQAALDGVAAGTVYLPAGVYRTLRVTIGAGEGHNWWCVVFPTLCTAASLDEFESAAASGGFTDGELRLITGADEGYVLKFKTLEWLEKLKALFD